MADWEDPIETMEEYVSAVIAGEIIACKSVIAACKRHRKDLSRQGDQDFPFYFDEEHARNVCDFFPTCISHSIGKDVGKPFVLQPWQVFAVASIFGWKSTKDKCRRYKKAYISVARKNGKAEHIDNWLPTPDGMKQMKHVQAGDYLIGEDGNPVQVQAVTEIQNDRPCVEIVFSDGERIVCDENHEWVFRKKRKKGSRGEKPSIYFTDKVVESKDLLGKELCDSQGAKYRVKNVVFEGTHQDLPVDPYVLGAWLGDGHSAGCSITGEQDDIQTIINAIEYAGYKWSRVSSGNKPDHIWTISVTNGKGNPTLTNDLKKAGVLRNKHIPSQYFIADVKQRIALLQGLMDTDGTISESGQCEFTQMSGQLADDVKKLLNSLGVHCKPIKCDARIDGISVGEKTRLLFFPPSWLMPFRLPRKRQRVRVKKKDGTRKVVSVTRLPENQKTKCVQVEGGVYLTGNYVLTHNSTLAAAICTYCAGFDYNPISKGFENVAQVVLAASKKEQADRVTMAECVRMREQSNLLKEMSDYKNRQITFSHNSGHIITIGSDKAFDGLSPHCCNVDEMHAFRSSGNQKEFIDTMKTGSGARTQSIFLVTTTAGSTASDLWKSEWNYATGVASGEYDDNSYFCLSYELDEEDDPLDSSVWIKANPCMGVTLSKEYLEDQAKPAAADNVSLNRFTRYHGNRLVSNLDTAFNLDQWDACQGELSDWYEAEAVGCGIDLGARDDLASLCFCARFPTEDFVEDADGNQNPIYRYEFRSYSYIALDSVRDISAKPFCDFIQDGHLVRSKFPLSELERDCVERSREFGCWQVAFDPYNAQQAGERISQEGIEAVTMAQTTRHFNEPIGELRQAIIEGRVRHDGNPLLRWAIGNAVLVTDRQDRVMYAKDQCQEKIDPAVAATMSFARCIAMPSRSTGYFTF